MPKTFVIKGESISNLLSQGSHLYIVVTARVEDFPTDIPLTPNIREPNKKSSTYKEIFNSLVGEPKAFFNRNNGIKISAKKATQSADRKELHIEILQDSEGYTHFGVYDGGHTVTAINAAKNLGIDLKEARVKVEVTCGLNEEEVAVCALAGVVKSRW
ncbi:AIPR family protein [Tolypothrix bouteillei VB521301_2]|uniref:AIPR family protein n=1 Tax=Tolypothrix bouteillei TaxID=1246981 RepID=UPI0038B485F5